MFTATLSGEIHLKSNRTQKRFIKRITPSVALAAGVTADRVRRLTGNRLVIDAEATDDRMARVARVFGVARANHIQEVKDFDLDSLAAATKEVWGDKVATGSYGVRVKRVGEHNWKGQDAERLIGSVLNTETNTVNLRTPDHWVRVLVHGDTAWITETSVSGPNGLPLGTQEPVLSLLSGGFDSVVAAWMMMSRGCPVHFVHFTLDCAQSDHAIAVADTLQSSWGYGTSPRVHLIDFQPVKESIRENVEPRMRQVTLKVLMAKTAERIAEQNGIGALVTGDALGQVSSQTLTHLRAIDASIDIPMLRPLLGFQKQDIIAKARLIGTADLSARAKEVCDLSEGLPVAVEAPLDKVADNAGRISDSVIDDIVSRELAFRLSDWFPGAYRFEQTIPV